MANMKKVKGIHLPNRNLYDGELERIKSLGCTHYVDLDLFPSRWESLAQGSQIHVRMFIVRATYEEIISLLEKYPSITTLRIGNEPNLETKLTPTDWEDYLTKVFTKLPCWALDKMSIAAPSPGLNNYMDWIETNVRVAKHFGLNQIDAHIYGGVEDVIDLMSIYRSFWDKKIIVTEYNFGAGRNYSISQWCNDYRLIMKQAAYYVDSLCAFIWEWNNPDMYLPTKVDIVGTELEKVITNTEEIEMYEDFTSPNNSGPRSVTKVITLHGTRGGNININLHDEFAGSVAWHFNPNSDASCHCIVGLGEVAYPVREDLKCWADWEYNDISLALEMVQPTLGYVIPQSIQLAAARQCAVWCVKYRIPIQWSITNGICEHRETPPGKEHGKSDIGNLNRDWFLQQVKTFAQLLAPKPRLTQQRISDLKLLPLWYLACIDAGEDWTRKTKEEAIAHIKAVGGPWQNIESIGWK